MYGNRPVYTAFIIIMYFKRVANTIGSKVDRLTKK